MRGSKLGTNVGVVFRSLNPSAHWVEKCDHSSFKKDSWRLILLWLSKFSFWHEADILQKTCIDKWIKRCTVIEFGKINWNYWQIWLTGHQLLMALLLSHLLTNQITIFTETFFEKLITALWLISLNRNLEMI